MHGHKRWARPIHLKLCSIFLRFPALPKELPVSCAGKAWSICCVMIKIIFLNGTFGNIPSSIRGISLNRTYEKNQISATEIFFYIIFHPLRNFKNLLMLLWLWSAFPTAINLLNAPPAASPTSASTMRLILSAGSVSSANRFMRCHLKTLKCFSYPPSITSASNFSSS